MENANIMWYEDDELAIGFNSMPHVCVRYITPSMTEDEVKSIKKYPFICKTELSNLVLASKQKNQARGNADIRNFANKKTIIEYLSQFIDVKIEGFDGNKYINGIIKTLTILGVIK